MSAPESPQEGPQAVAPAAWDERLRQRLSVILLDSLDYHLIGEWICCDPVNPEHELCVKGDIARKMVRMAVIDDEQAYIPRSPVLDAVMAEVIAPLLVGYDRQIGESLRYAEIGIAHAQRAEQAERERDELREVLARRAEADLEEIQARFKTWKENSSEDR